MQEALHRHRIKLHSFLQGAHRQFTRYKMAENRKSPGKERCPALQAMAAAPEQPGHSRVVFHRDSGDLYIWISTLLSWGPSEDQTRDDSWLYSDFWPWACACTGCTPTFTPKTVFTRKGFNPFSLLHPCKELSQTPSTSPRHVPGWWCREGAGRLWDTSKRIIHRGHFLTSPAPPASSAKPVPFALVHNKSFCPPSCSALHPEPRKGYGEEEGATVLHMKHRISRIAQDMGRVKDEEVLPKS